MWGCWRCDPLFPRPGFLPATRTCWANVGVLAPLSVSPSLSLDSARRLARASRRRRRAASAFAACFGLTNGAGLGLRGGSASAINLARRSDVSRSPSLDNDTMVSIHKHSAGAGDNLPPEQSFHLRRALRVLVHVRRPGKSNMSALGKRCAKPILGNLPSLRRTSFFERAHNLLAAH